MQVLGIYIDKPFVRFALIERKAKETKIISLKSFSLDDAEGVKQFYKTKFKGKSLAALPSEKLLLESFESPSLKPAEIDQAIRFHMEAVGHFSPNEFSFSLYKQKKSGDSSEVHFFLTPKDEIKGQLELLNSWGIDPDCMSTIATSLIHFLVWKKPDLKNAFLIDLSASETTCLSIRNGILEKAHSIHIGTGGLLTALWKDRKKTLFQKEIQGIAKQIDLLEFQKSLNTHLFSSLSTLRRELSKTLYAFEEGGGPLPILFTGQIDTFRNFEEFLLEGKEEQKIENLELKISKDEARFAGAIGAALEYGPEAVQFRNNEFFSEKQFVKAGKYLILLFLLSLTAMTTLVFFAKHYESSHIQNMASFLSHELSLKDEPLKKKVFENGEEDALRRWSQLTSLYQKKYPFVLNCPNVTKTLSFLYNHPAILETQKDEEPIEILAVHYKLSEYPHLENPKAKYRGKVEAYFKIQNTQRARKFHEQLLKDHSLLDVSEGLDWETEGNTYRATFSLKLGDNG